MFIMCVHITIQQIAAAKETKNHMKKAIAFKKYHLEIAAAVGIRRRSRRDDRQGHGGDNLHALVAGGKGAGRYCLPAAGSAALNTNRRHAGRGARAQRALRL
jgi:hypothetical protein